MKCTHLSVQQLLVIPLEHLFTLLSTHVDFQSHLGFSAWNHTNFGPMVPGVNTVLTKQYVQTGEEGSGGTTLDTAWVESEDSVNHATFHALCERALSALL